jgi:probable HAF family extracellular repeat protein
VEEIMKSRVSTIVVVFVCLALFPTIGAAQEYAITDLGTLSPTGINSWAQVVGNYGGHAFVWSRLTGMRDLGTLPGGTFSNAAAISDFGVIAGTADGEGTVKSPFPDEQDLTCTTLDQPFVWTWKDGMRGLGTVGFAGGVWRNFWCDAEFLATGINRAGDVTGYNPDIGSYEWGFVWTKNNGMRLVQGGYQTMASAINIRTQVVGAYDPVNFLDTNSHAVLWRGQTMIDLGTLGGADTDWLYCSGANSVNDLGQVVGWSSTQAGLGFFCPIGFNEDVPHAFLWLRSKGMRDLGTLPGDTSSEASKINFFGQVIGISGNTVRPAGNPIYEVIGRPFIWSERTGMRDLNALIFPNSGWILNTATDLNFWGQIVGQGTRNGQLHGFLLTPRRPFQHP